jgi:hypothetical protein
MFTENKQALNLAVTGEPCKQVRERKENAGTQKGELSAYRYKDKRGDKRD